MTKTTIRDNNKKISRADYQALTEQVPGIVYQFRLKPDGAIEIPYINNSVRELTGLSSAEVIADPDLLFDQVPAEDRDVLKKAIARSAAELSDYIMEHRSVSTDGRTRWLKVNARPQREPDGSILWHGLAIDITDYKQTEAALKEGEERFKIAGRVSYDLVYEWSVADNSLEWFGDVDGLLGFEPGEVSGDITAWLALIHPDDRLLLENAIEFHRTSVEPIRYDYKIRQKNGKYRYWSDRALPLLDENKQPYKWVGVCTDITEHKEMEEALFFSEERFSLFAQHLPGLVYIKDHKTRYLFVNDKCHQYFGIPSEQMLGKTALEIFPIEKSIVYLDTDKQVLESNQPIAVTEKIVKPDGEAAIMMNHKFLIKRADQPPLIAGFYIDITDRIRAEEALRISEEKMGSIFRASPIGIGLVSNRTIVEVNDRFCNMIGYSKDELIGQLARMVYPSDEDFEYVGQEKYRQIKKMGMGTVETRFKRKDGKVIDILMSSAPLDPSDLSVGVTFSALDISDRKQAQRDLQDAQQRLLTILSGIEAHIYVADMNNHEILFMNKCMQAAFGSDFTGQICYRAFKNEIKPCPDCTNHLLVDTQNKPTKVVVWESRDQITKRWYINYDRAIEWVDGRIVRLQIATDITELKKAEQDKENLESRLRQAQKMEAIGTLAGGIAHDFNNLLTPIIGYSELALDDAKNGFSNPQDIKEILKAGNRAKDLVTQILAFSRKLEPELKPVDLNRVIDQTGKMLVRTIPKMIEIHHHLADDLWLINADASQLSQVLLNLGTNAKDAMPDGGRLVIETKNITLDAEYCSQHAEVSPGDYVLLIVSDTGFGIDKKILPHIFDPFFTQKEIGQGTGLGLATVFGIIKTHGGSIMCYSEAGQGTTFKAYLPAIRSADERDFSQKTLDDVVPGGHETILLVDDEETLRDLGRQILTRQGYKTLMAETGEEALEIYQEKGAGIDLVVLDISMPGMGGRKCLIELLKINPAAKVIIASGYALNGQLEDIIASGASKFVAKPYMLMDLLTAVRDVLDR